MSTIPVICDRCRSVGNSGEGDFSHLGDLLDFAPVKRRKRLNGWDEDAQRAFIAALAMTGSKTAAAKSLGRNGFGIDQLLKSEGSESFRLAYDRAIAIAEKNGAMRLATGVADAAARNKWLDKRSALRGIEPEEEPTMSDDHKWELVQAIGTKFLRKVAAEREARLAGEIVAADFYLRQITQGSLGGDGSRGAEARAAKPVRGIRRRAAAVGSKCPSRVRSAPGAECRSSGGRALMIRQCRSE